MKTTVKYAAGEARCAHCNNPIPVAVEAWSGHRLFFCDREGCQDAAKNQPNRRYIGENEKPCCGPGCGNCAPAGSYDLRHIHFVCSGKCWRRLQPVKLRAANPLVACACGCGREVRSGKAKDRRYFYSRECVARSISAQTWTRFGQHEPTFKEYFERYAQRHYRDAGKILTVLSRFAQFANERNITDLSRVTSKVITDYLNWGAHAGFKKVATSVSHISVFYEWMRAEGRSTLTNPVVSFIHRTKPNRCEPRPLEEDEIEFALAILEKRGNNRMLLAFWIGLEAGLRIKEISRIRLQDVDARKQRIFVLPSKNGRSRTVFFGDMTRKYLDLWLKERDPDCGHDRLLHGKLRRPATPQSLRQEFNKILTKRGSTQYGSTRTNPDGFDRWSTHRLRHSMTSRLINGGATYATIQAQGGWSSEKPMLAYARIDPEVVERGYRAAMKRAKELAKEKKPRRPLSLSEYAKQRKSKR